MKNSISALLLLAGCATAAPLTLPSGAQGQIVRCDGEMLSIADCYVKAGKVCPAGYDILGGDEEGHPIMAGGGVSNSGGSSYSFFGSSIVTRSLMVQCKT